MDTMNFKLFDLIKLVHALGPPHLNKQKLIARTDLNVDEFDKRCPLLHANDTSTSASLSNPYIRFGLYKILWKMDCLRQAYPVVPDHFLESALIKAELDVIDALDLLKLDFGEPSDDGTNFVCVSEITVDSSDDLPGPRPSFWKSPPARHREPESSRAAAAVMHSDNDEVEP
jgi:hypothetical protein